MFAIPLTIGNFFISQAMLDLGASINVMPSSLYEKLNLGPLLKTGIIIQLADRSNVYPKGVIEDVLVKVNDLTFPADFFVIDMGQGGHEFPILLERPFLMTAQTKIDVSNGTLSMEFDGERVEFNMKDAMKYPDDHDSLNFVGSYDGIVQEEVDKSPKHYVDSNVDQYPIDEYYPIDGPYESLGVDLSCFSLESSSHLVGHVGVVDNTLHDPKLLMNVPKKDLLLDVVQGEMKGNEALLVVEK